ncbi:MAG TPA: outer membrane beta-barrel protein, partial [Verrucomicrobiae bacterium]|nr:outer membrane beta-barrel protein [Verrucomicrobiae bacterium]
MAQRVSWIAAAAVIGFAGTASAQDWQGFYIGAHAGYTDGEAEMPYGAVGGPFVSDQDAADVSGAVYGIQGGYNWQLGSSWVVGLEAQGTWGDREGDDGGSGGDLNGVEIYGEGSLRARGGYLFTPNTLGYLTGGYVMMHVDADAPDEGVIGDEIEGWTYGLGVEHRFGRNWSAFAEARHDDMSEERFSFLSDNYDEGITPVTDTLRLGVNYRFAAAAA